MGGVAKVVCIRRERKSKNESEFGGIKCEEIETPA
jgi:hypothetical protein